MCPSGCSCLLFAAQCQNKTITSILLLQALTFEILLLTNCTFTTVDVQHILWKSIKLGMTHSNLEIICESVNQMELLSHLNVGFNFIRNITNNCFQRSCKLKLLELNNNLISKIHDKGIWMLPSLIFLNLSSNHLKSFCLSFINNSKTLRLLSLFNYSFDEMKSTAFQEAGLLVLEVHKLEICCFLPSTAKCTNVFHESITCSGLLPNIGTKVVFNIVSAVLVLLNFASIILQKIFCNKGLSKLRTYPLIVGAVNIADISLSMPLHILWIADKVFGEIFILRSTLWQSGPVCYVAYTVFLSFSIISPTIHCILAYSKFSVVRFPIQSNFKETRFVRNVILTGYCISLSIAVGFTLIHTILCAAVPHKICLPFSDDMISPIFTITVTAFVLFGQIVAFCFMSYFFWKLVGELNASDKKFEGAARKKKVSASINAQILATTSSFFLTWIASGTIYMAGLLTKMFPADLLVWTTILILPLNSLISPVLFIVPTAIKLLSL